MQQMFSVPNLGNLIKYNCDLSTVAALTTFHTNLWHYIGFWKCIVIIDNTNHAHLQLSVSKQSQSSKISTDRLSSTGTVTAKAGQQVSLIRPHSCLDGTIHQPELGCFILQYLDSNRSPGTCPSWDGTFFRLSTFNHMLPYNQADHQSYGYGDFWVPVKLVWRSLH